MDTKVPPLIKKQNFCSNTSYTITYPSTVPLPPRSSIRSRSCWISNSCDRRCVSCISSICKGISSFCRFRIPPFAIERMHPLDARGVPFLCSRSIRIHPAGAALRGMADREDRRSAWSMRGRQPRSLGRDGWRVEIFHEQARRRWSEEDKRRLVAETFGPGATVHGVARRHGVSPSQLFAWRKLLRAGSSSAAVPAPGYRASPRSRSRPRRHRPRATVADASGLIEIELAGGGRVRISGAPDPAVVAAALRALAGR